MINPRDQTETNATAGVTPHVFISFASEDVELAHRVVQRLEGSGFRCWISNRDIEPATSYPAAITGAVAASGALLLLLTESANRSRHVLREVELAFSTGKPILSIQVSGATPSSDLQYFLSTIQWFDAGVEFDDADLAKVEPRLEELLRGGGTTGGGGGKKRPWRTIAIIAALVLAAGATVSWWWVGRPAPDEPSSAAATEPPPETPGAAEESSGAAPDSGSAATTMAPATPGAATTPRVSSKVNPRGGQAYVWVPPGRFTMGCSAGDPACRGDEKPSHAVNISRGFWLARTEVTAAQFAKRGRTEAAGRAGPDDGLPAIAVSWAAAKAYCADVGGRLPTEAEWEYAARAGTSERYYDSPAATAWFADNSDGRPHPVGTKAPNAFGLHDMLGNVAEWVLDRYYNAYDDSSDPTVVEEPLAGNASGVARGGSWISEAQGVRVSRRLEMLPDAEEPHIGLRCAMDAL